MKRLGALALVIGLSGTLYGCGGGPGEEEFVEACLKSQGGSEAMCRCMAHSAKEKLPDKAWTAFVLETQGRAEDAEELKKSMTTQEQAAMFSAAMEIASKCMGIE